MAMQKKEEKKEYMFKMVIIGDAATGKSSILRRYCENKYEENYVCTIIEFQLKIIPLSNGKLVKLQIWDTAGQERFTLMTEAYYRNTKAAMVIYDITRRETFEHVKKWADRYLQLNEQVADQRVPQALTILGNKKDLEDRRQVSYEEGKTMATSLGGQFFEVSAKMENDDIKDIFAEVVTALAEHQEKCPTIEQGNTFTQNRDSIKLSSPAVGKANGGKKTSCCK